MTLRDLVNSLSVVETLAPASRNAAANGAGVDLRGFDSAAVVIERGAEGGTSPSFTFEVQESDDNSVYTAVADADLDGTEPVVTEAGTPVKIGYQGNKRYIRAAITEVTGGSPTLLCAASVIRGHAHQRPV